MEAFLIIATIIGVFIIRAMLNKNEPTPQMEKLSIRVKERRLDESDPSSPMVNAVEGKGLLPHRHETNISFIISLRDDAAGNRPILCPIKSFHEPNTIAYQCENPIGRLEPCGIRDWHRLGIIIPILIPPYGGKRQLTAVVRMIDADNPPEITAGFVTAAHSGVIWETTVKFDWTHDSKGYEETKEDRDEARALSLKIAMAVAMADGNLDSMEGALMQNWIKREISSYEGKQKEHLKNLYNTALRESFAEAKRRNLNIDALAARLNEIGEKSIKYETIELCFDVMSADGVAHSEEMKTIRLLAKILELDMREIENMFDANIVGLSTDFTKSNDAENLLGIEPSWSAQKIEKHLSKEFMKWNGRMESLPAGKARDNAQHMLHAIAEIKNNINKEKSRDE